MKRLIAGVILIAFNSIVVWGQQTEKPSLRTPTPVQTVAPTESLPDVGSFQLSAPHFPSGQSKINDQLTRLTGQSATPVGPFVVMNCKVYVRLAGDFLVPMSGGGASGCFSVDLPERIEKLKELVPKLDSFEKDPQPY
jgi:hypothetical protein